MNTQLTESIAKDITETEAFIRHFGRITAEAHNVNVRNGWWQKRELIDKELLKSNIDYTPHLLVELLGLVGTEVSEAIESVRKHPPESWADPYSKDTLVRELAGTIVRIMDLSAKFNLPLAMAIIQEIKHNETRGHRHGGKAA